MFNTNSATHVMAQSMSDQFLSRLVAGYILIQKEQYSEANEHFNKMLYSEHNPSDDDILWIAKSHIYKKLGKQEESETCMKLVTDSLANTPIMETRMYK
mgnify:CR=1 FL=1|jgi:uncharacterized protein HemY